MHSFSKDTIAAISTPPGAGGIAVLRISGPEVLTILSRLFVPAKERDFFHFRPRFLHYGHVSDSRGRVLDEVLAVFMPGPRSFTGEDVGEIHCHGGLGVSAALLEAALDAGARPAGPGEFTRRAFMNGRLDLTQAEAVAELISAPSPQGARLAAAKLDGALGRQIRAIRAAVDALRSQVILAVDFPDEEAELLCRDAFARTIEEARTAVRRLLASFERARLWREGALAVIAGRVNAGKSSLLNALLGRERAIVSSAPGTTRDYLEENVNLKGLLLRLVDTAGLRQGGDLVEEEGIRRSRCLAEEADILLFVRDAGEAPHPEERDFLRRHAKKAAEGKLLLVLNKADALERPPCAESAFAQMLGQSPCVVLSAKTGEGLDVLSQAIYQALTAPPGTEVLAEAQAPVQGDIAPNLRQSGLLRQALSELEALAEALREGMPSDMLGVHLDTLAELLDEVSGSSGTEELLDRIFASFCIGK